MKSGAIGDGRYRNDDDIRVVSSRLSIPFLAIRLSGREVFMVTSL